MSISRPAYCTREDVLSALDVRLTSRTRTLVDAAICSGAQRVDSLCNRTFYPTTGTKYFDYPTTIPGKPWRLYLNQHELVSLSALSAGGTSISTGNVNLEPQASGPPYTYLELNLSLATAFGVGSTFQRNIAVTGAFGYGAATAPAGLLAEALDSSETGVDVTDSSAVGVGDLLISGTEYMLVTEASMVTTGQTLQTPVSDTSAVTTIAVTTGTAYTVGEVIQLDSEQMEITSITGNSLSVDRAVRGTVLASHTGSTIYAPRSLTVVRGYAGTTAAAHNDATALSRHLVPAMIHELALAESTVAYAQLSGGYARPAGSSGRTQPQPGAGLEDVRSAVFGEFGRIRKGVV